MNTKTITEERKILKQLCYGELSVGAIQRELKHRQVSVPYGSHLTKAELSEVLRMSLEQTQDPGSLTKLRAYEIAAVRYARQDALAARLKSRGLTPHATRAEMLNQLFHVLSAEKTEFERQNKENIPPKQDNDDDSKKGKGSNAITPEQRERMQKNRKRALELQANKQGDRKIQRTEALVDVTEGPSRPSPNNGTMTPANFISPLKSKTKLPGAPASNPFSTIKCTGVVSPVASLYSPVAPSKKPNEMRTNQVEAPSTPTVQGQSNGYCSRCGENPAASKKSLCIVWNHTGDIKKETGSDQYRWDCCGRLDGQPCFVGLHSPEPTGSQVLSCDCGEPAVLKRTRKPQSNNRGRYFFVCNKCNFFRWANEAYGLEKQEVLVAPDGVREWEVPFANPYGAESRCRNPRQKLVAALLLQELCFSALGQSCSGICSNEVTSRVLHTVYKGGGNAILWKMQPLTTKQLSERFDWPNTTLAGLHDKECEAILMDLLEQSDWVRSIGVRYQPGPEGESSVFVDLAGLEAYLNC